MTRPQRTRVRALALALLLLAASLGAGAVAGQAATPGETATQSAAEGPAVGPATAGPGVDADRTEVAPITRCFTGSGYPISIGDGEGGATMETVVHLSVLTDPGAGNEFGVETAGRLDGEPIVVLAAGVRLTARQAIADGIDPFAAFDVLYTYELQLPMFAGSVGDADYEDDGSPIESSAGAIDC
ncbi:MULTISPECIES: DUF7332 family protein [Halorubrum]|uniref:Uncharacterized protein n=1 Tax=Halorubrum ruber TaxID=2982524 RepID=A0A8T8LHJ5_9EURY|nr:MULTISPECIES: hypothetical protein [Halorubrum]QUO46652.1 hypothetical protein J7656_08440 [Halorubrum ruber]